MKKLIKTVAVVTIFSCVERLLGFIYRIYLSRVLGSEGVGIYQIALSIVGLLMTVTASGIPITVSRLITKSKAYGTYDLRHKVVSSGILLSLAFSLPVIGAIYFFPDKFSFIFADERCMQVLTIILPGIIITSVYSVIRGSFWGEKRFFTYSVIELLEEAVMLVFGIILINRATSLMSGVRRAAYAVLLSYVFSFVTALVVYFIGGGKPANPFPELKPLISSSAPITVMRTTTSLLNSLIAVLLPARLIASGLSSSEALSSFGEISGMSIPLIYIPSTLIGSIALVLVPELSENYYSGRLITLKNNVEKAIKCSVFISCMIIPVFLSMGREIGEIIYDNETAGIYVERACIIMLPMSITLITTSMLNSLNMEKMTLLYFLIGSAFIILSVYFLPRYIGVYSLVLGLLLSYTVTTVANLILLRKKSKSKLDYAKFILLSILFIIPSYLMGRFSKEVLLHFIAPLPSVIIAGGLTVIFNYLLFYIFKVFDIKKLVEN